MLTRREIKLQAKSVFRSRMMIMLLISLAYFVISTVLSTLELQLMGFGAWADEVMRRFNDASERIMAAVTPDEIEAILSSISLPDISDYNRGAFATLLSQLLALMATPLTVGYMYHALLECRGVHTKFDSLFYGFRLLWKTIVIQILTMILVGLASLLFIIPGLILVFRYSMAFYILLDDPSKGPIQCMRESGELMRGHKMEFFVLRLSFIGWYLLGMLIMMFVGLDILSLWLMPYVTLTNGIYYSKLVEGRWTAQYGDTTEE